MKTTIQNIDDSKFNETVLNGITVVDFWAPWCVPCQMQGPILEKLAEGVGETVKITKVNVDSNPLTAQNYGISSIPTIMVFKDGEVQKQFVGVQSEEVLRDAVSQLS